MKWLYFDWNFIGISQRSFINKPALFQTRADQATHVCGCRGRWDNFVCNIRPQSQEFEVNLLKPKCCNLDEIFVTGTACCHFDIFRCNLWREFRLNDDISVYPMLRADSRFWLVNNREIWSRISRLTSSAWDIKTKERHWWRHNGDSDRRPLSLPLRYDLVTLCLYDDLGQINVIAEIVKLRKRFRMSQILFEHGINSLPLVCFRGYGNLSTLSIAIPRLAFGRAWYCDAACG